MSNTEIQVRVTTDASMQLVLCSAGLSILNGLKQLCFHAMTAKSRIW